MPNKVPSYRQRNDSDQAIVTLMDAMTKQRRDYWLGIHGTPESRERYHRLIAQWEAQGRTLPSNHDTVASTAKITIEQMIGEYWTWAQRTYAPREVHCIKIALRILRKMFASTPAAGFGPKKLRLVREQMIRGDATDTPPRKPWVSECSRRRFSILAVGMRARGRV